MNQTLQLRCGGVPMAQNSNTQARCSFRKRLSVLALLAMLVMCGGKAWGQTFGNGSTLTGPDPTWNFGFNNDIHTFDGVVEVASPIYVITLGVAPFNHNSTYTVRPYNGSCTIKRASGYTGPIFKIAASPTYSGAQWDCRPGHLIIESGVTIDGDSPSGDVGPCIEIEGAGTCNLTGVIIQNNRSNMGAAIYSKASTNGVVCTNCQFINNHTTSSGGAISCAGYGIITNCSFSNNSSDINGGAFFNGYSNTSYPTTLTSCRFTNNSAGVGGAIFNGGALTCTGTSSDRCIFVGNTGSDSSNGAGAIFSFDNLTCEYCDFGDATDSNKKNTGVLGGAVLTGNGSFSNCRFYYNEANTATGGAIHIYSGTTSISSCTFIGNHAALDGGAIYSAANKLTCTSVSFGDGTQSNRNYARNGGAVYAIEELSCSGCTFNYNQASVVSGAGGNGGAIYYGGATSNVTAKLTNSSLTNNRAAGWGGAILVSKDSDFSYSNFQIEKSGSGTMAINSNQAVNGGGVYVNGGTFNMIDGSITYNTASGNGGGVYQNGTMKVQGLIVIENNEKSSAANNVYLNTNKLVTINTNGLECGSHIGINNSTADLQVVTGPVAKVQHAYRNGFFFQDANTYGVFPSTTNTFAPASTNLYLANLTGGAINTFPLATGAVAGTDYVGSAGGNITQVKTVKGMAFLAKDVFDGNTYSGKTVTLANDITFGSGDYWEPIGFRAFSSDDCNGNDADHPFSGTFNGNGHIITNLQGNLGYRDFGLFGYVLNGTIQNVIIASGTGGKAAENLGGLVGYQNGGQIQYCQVILTSLTGENGATAAIGGIVGRLESAKLHSCSAIPGALSNGTAMGGLVGVVASGGKLYNSYANTNLAAFGSNSGDVQNCYVRKISGSGAGTGTYTATSSSNGTFTAVQTPYLYRHADNQVTIGGATTNLVDKLNSWSNSYPKWTRTMASPINDDYPILMLPNTTCVGTKSGSSVLNYGSSLNTMLGSHNASGDNIYFWGTESGISTSNGSANVFFAENAAIIHTSSIANAHVGITLSNASGAGGHWHMFSPALSNAPLGINYNNDNTQWPFSLTHPSGMPYYLFTQKSESNSTYGYFPSHLFGQSYPANNTSLTGSNAGNYYNDWDYYCYLESQYHWINFKRNSNSHWHEDGNHDPISYSNESTMTRGKGYLVATTYPTFLEAKGTLNQGSFTIPVTRNGEYRTGYNFLGNPYQSYLDFDAFADVNKALWGGTKTNASYLILDKDGYTYYAYSGSANQITSSANRYLHPHQGFMIVATAAGNATFNNAMRNITATAPFRDDHIDYPLVNLIATEEDGNRDIVTVELGRPEVGGAFKQYDMHLGKGCIYTHYEDADYAIAFTLPGLSEIGIRFETDEDATYTMTWDMENGEFSYLHLIDNITGSDIDCLTATEYRFTARPSDYKSRFKLVFEYTGVEEQEDGPSTGSGTFAFMMGNELVVNCGPSTGSGTAGTATLQMFDMMGRLVMQKTVNGTQTTIAMPEMTAGVYVLRLSDNNGSRVQKIVIE